MGRPPATLGQTPKPAEKPAADNSAHHHHHHRHHPHTKRSKEPPSYKSDGVDDNDVFLLPISDYNIMFGLTILAAVVRLFRIYQPSSVVFDEVQYVSRQPPVSNSK
jgi:hypothetical protein